MPCLCVQVLKKNPAAAILPRIFWGFPQACALTSPFRTFLPGGPSASLESIWERGAGSTGLALFSNSPTVENYVPCSSTTNSTLKSSKDHPLKPAVFDFHWLPLPQSEDSQPDRAASALIKGQIKHSVFLLRLFSHPPPLPELSWNSTAKNDFSNLVCYLSPQAKNTAVADELKREGLLK